MRDRTEDFVRLAEPAQQERCRRELALAGGDWAALQRALLGRVDEYLHQEAARGADYCIDTHEAGGAWRIAFPHLRVRPDDRILAHLSAMMRARREHAKGRFFHGFPDEAEVHHEIETFLYFQMPLYFLTGDQTARESIEDLAHHVGNWADGVPAWYDWARHGFRSTWLGTRNVRAHPPHDYQEGNHFRFVGVCLAAHAASGDVRYVELATDYAERWCDHIERAAGRGEAIPCQILPEGVPAAALGRAGSHDDPSRYRFFYYPAAVNTAYDVFCGLTDVWRMTGRDRCLRCAKALANQFFLNGRDGRPALYWDGERWHVPPADCAALTPQSAIQQWPSMLARMALRHDLLTGRDDYRRAVLDWAGTIDERSHGREQMMADVLTAAHYYTGDSAYLARAYAMDLRTWAVTETADEFLMCSATTRGGAKFMMELAYLPILLGCDWGTRGNLPLESLRHEHGNGSGLPRAGAFRVWRIDGTTDGVEVACDREAKWRLHGVSTGRRLVAASLEDRPLQAAPSAAHAGTPPAMEIEAPRGRATGRLTWQRPSRQES